MTRYHQLEAPIREYVLKAWLYDTPTTIRDCARAIGETDANPSSGAESYSTPLNTWKQKAIDSGVLVIGRIQDYRHEKLPIVAWNWTGRALVGQTLLECYDAFRADPKVRPRDREELNTALRAVLSHIDPAAVVGTRTVEALRVAAGRIPAQGIRELPRIALTLPTSKRNEYARLIRRMMRSAFHANAVAVYVRPRRSPDAWNQEVDEICPLSVEGITSRVVLQARAYLARLRDALEAKHADPPSRLSDLSADAANAALDWIITGDRALKRAPNRRSAREIKAVLIALGERGVGPFRGLAEFAGAYTRRLDGRHFGFRYTLTPTEGSGVKYENTWASVRGTLASHGVPDEVLDYWRFVEDYSTLSGIELRTRYPNLSRPVKRELRGASVNARLQAMRIVWGFAIDHLGIKPSEATVGIVLGERFHELINELRVVWSARAADAAKLTAQGLPVRGFATTENGRTLERIIINAGLLAHAALEYSRWSRGLAGLRVVTTKGGNERVISGTEEIVAMERATVEEVRWAEAYRTSLNWAAEVQRERERSNELDGAGRTHKNLEEIIADLPAIALMPAALERLSKAINRCPCAHATMVAAARLFAMGLTATGSSRVGELPQLRLDTHLTADDRAKRRVSLTRGIRKNDWPHQLPLHPEVLPSWLVDYYLDVARPALIEGCARHHGEDHGFVLVRASGSAFPNEDARARAGASATLGKAFERWRERELFIQGHTVVKGGFGHHTPHSERSRMTQAALASGCTDEDLSILLGHKGVTVARINYTMTMAEMISAILDKILKARPWATAENAMIRIAPQQRRRAPAAIDPNRSARLVLIQGYDAGDMSPREFAEKIRALELGVAL